MDHGIVLNSLRNQWWEAVERGGLGDGAAALTMLDRLRERARTVDACEVISLAWSTTASLHRQSGRHDLALGFDAAALTALDDPFGSADPWVRVAAHDAVVGLAADNLGLFRFAASGRLLSRARELLGRDVDDAAANTWSTFVTDLRPRVRERWVGGELAIYTGDADQARRLIGEAQIMMASVSSDHERHHIKTDLIAAASANDTSDAAAVAQACLRRARGGGFVPLTWASLSLLQGLGDTSYTTIAAIAASHDMLVDRGMPFAGRSQIHHDPIDQATQTCNTGISTDDETDRC